MAPFNFQSWRPYKLVKMRSSSFRGPNLVFLGLVGFGGAAAAAVPWWRRGPLVDEAVHEPVVAAVVAVKRRWGGMLLIIFLLLKTLEEKRIRQRTKNYKIVFLQHMTGSKWVLYEEVWVFPDRAFLTAYILRSTHFYVVGRFCLRAKWMSVQNRPWKTLGPEIPGTPRTHTPVSTEQNLEETA